MRRCPKCGGHVTPMETDDGTLLQCVDCDYQGTPPDHAMRQAGAPPLIPE